MQCLLTILSGKLLPIRDEIIQHRQRICAKCNMHCVVWSGSATRPVSWMKIRALRESTSRCTETLWLDADATPIRMFHFPTATPRADVVAVRDMNGLNAGIMLVQSTAWVNDTLRVVWNRREFINHPWWEQEALRRSIYEMKLPDAEKSIRLTQDVSAHFHHVAGCFSTQKAHHCRRRILDSIRAFRDGECREVTLRTHAVTRSDVMPH